MLPFSFWSWEFCTILFKSQNSSQQLMSLSRILFDYDFSTFYSTCSRHLNEECILFIWRFFFHWKIQMSSRISISINIIPEVGTCHLLEIYNVWNLFHQWPKILLLWLQTSQFFLVTSHFKNFYGVSRNHNVHRHNI